MSELVTKVEATPLIAYTSTTECIRPTSLVITTTYPTACVTLTTAERRPSATTSPPTTTTALGRTPTTVALLSSSVSAPHTTFRTPVSSTTATPERASLATASIQTPSPLIAATTPLPSPASTFETATAATHDPASTSRLTTPTTRGVAASALSAPTVTWETMSSTKTKLLGTDTPRETLTTGIPSIPPITSSIPPTNTVVSATPATSETTLEPTTTSIYTTFPTTEPHSPTAAATHTGKLTSAPSPAIPTWKTTLTPAKDISAASLMTEMPPPPTIPSLITPRNTVNSATPASSIPVTTSTLTSATSTRLSSLPAPFTKSVSSWTTNSTPLSTLITTLPTTHVPSTPISPTRTGTMATTEIPTPTNISTIVTLNTASLPTSSTPETTTTIGVTTPTPTIPHSTPGVTSSNVYPEGSTTTSAITPAPSTTGTPRISPTMTTSSVSTGTPASTPTTVISTSRGPSGSPITITDLSSTITVSKMSAVPTSVIPSSPTVQDADTTPSVITASPAKPAVLTSTHGTPPPTLATNTPEIPSRLATTSSVTPMNTVDSLTSTASTPGTVTTKTLTSATRMHLSSLPAPTTESVSTSTANTTPSSTLNTRTSPTTSSLKTFATDTTTGCFLCSPTPCPDSVSVTIAPVSPATPCVETGPSSEVTSTPTNPVSVFTSPTEMATSPSSTSMTTARPMHTDTSTVLETHPAHSITAAPSSVGTGTVPSDTVVTSTQRPTSGNWMSTNSVTIPHMPGFTSLPLTPRPSSSFPTAVVTSSKSTHAAPTTTKTPETPAVTPRSTTTLTSPRTTLTTAQMTTRSRLTTTPGPCDNGGTWMQGLCHCPLGFSGDHCELQEIRCQNGGKWDGFRCHCPSTFYGSCCEFVADQVDLGTVDTEVDMEVSVDQEFSPDLNDSTSTAYKDFSDTFRDQCPCAWSWKCPPTDLRAPGLSTLSGSIVVVYLVLLELPFSLQLESEYEKMKTVLKEELQNVSYNGDSCQNNQSEPKLEGRFTYACVPPALCFKPDSVKPAICHRATAKGYEDFYFPLVEENRLCCVTKCTPGVDGAIDCHQGQCLLQRSGPACRCFSTDTHWFSGPRCEVAVAWRALVGGLVGVVVLLLLLLLASLSLFVALSRSRRGGQGGGQSWDDDRRWFEIWDEDTVGTFSNLGLEDDRTVKDEHFQVALENADTNVRGCSEISQAGRCETAVADTGPQGPPQLAAEPLRTSFPARMRPGHAACEQRMGKDEGCRCEPWGFTDMKKWQRSILMRGSPATTSTNYASTSTSNYPSSPSAMSTSVESTVTAAGSLSRDSAVSFYATGSSNSLSPSGFSTTTMNTGHRMTTFTELTSLFTTSPGLSKSAVSSGTSSTWEESTAVPSSLGHLSTTPIVSTQTDSGLTEGSTVYPGTPDLSKPTVTSNSTISRGDGVPASTSGTADSFTTHAAGGETTSSFAAGFTFHTTPSELSTSALPTHSSHSTDDASLASASSPGSSVTTKDDRSSVSTSRSTEPFSTSGGDDQTTFPPGSTSNTIISPVSTATSFHSSYSTDKTSPGFPSSPSDLSHPSLLSERTTLILTEEPIVYTSVSDFPKSTVSSETSFTNFEGSSASCSGSGHLSTTTGVPQHTSLNRSDGSTVYTDTPICPYLQWFGTRPFPESTSSGSTSSSAGTSSCTGQCQNGTSWNGEECVCAQGFSGYQCKSLVDSFPLEIPEKVNATLIVTAKVTNRNFTKDLNNISSPVYWNFTQLFKSQMDKTYMGKDFPQYRGGIIRRLLVTDESSSPGSSNGSDVVEPDVVMEANYTSDFRELFENLTKIVKVKIMNEIKRLSGDSEACREQCSQKPAKDYAQFYYVEGLGGKLACVTKGTSGTKLSPNCHERGSQLQRSSPAACEHPAPLRPAPTLPGGRTALATTVVEQGWPTSDTRYWGETCALSTGKSLVYRRDCGSTAGGHNSGPHHLPLQIPEKTAQLFLVFLLAGKTTIRLESGTEKMFWQLPEHRHLGRLYHCLEGSPRWGLCTSQSRSVSKIWFKHCPSTEPPNLKDEPFSLENIYGHFQPSLENIDPTTEVTQGPVPS
ncbi:hypothetical protein PANDA_017100 [Ailuropoda melanoleuca]|uniref:SEA domain-containing protein n=1 Tax=Ailuropoda melanoleuca TaxID=9646 RepID=D2HWZ9_AILME|nr:hypothetical protein PANDA_017100 [Ailuropoda melanoleuca]